MKIGQKVVVYICTQEYIQLDDLCVPFLLTSSETQKIPAKWPFLAYTTFVSQECLPGFSLEGHKICIVGRPIDYLVALG